MNELKVGQKVRIDLSKYKDKDGTGLRPDMFNHNGATAVIDQKSPNGRYYLSGIPWAWCEEWLKPIEEDQTITAHSVLLAASQHMIDRGKTYDKESGERSMSATVNAFKAVTGIDMTETQGWLFMALLKAVRANQRQAYHADSFEDMAAYVGLAAESKANEGK